MLTLSSPSDGLVGIDLRLPWRAVSLKRELSGYSLESLETGNTWETLETTITQRSIALALPEAQLWTRRLTFPLSLQPTEVELLIQQDWQQLFPDQATLIVRAYCLKQIQDQQFWLSMATQQSYIDQLLKLAGKKASAVAVIDTEGDAWIRTVSHLQEELPEHYGLLIMENNGCQGYIVQKQQLHYRQTIRGNDNLSACRQLLAWLKLQLNTDFPTYWLLSGQGYDSQVAAILQETFSLTVRAFNPLEKIAISDNIAFNLSINEGYALGVACGLALRGVL